MFLMKKEARIGIINTLHDSRIFKNKENAVEYMIEYAREFEQIKRVFLKNVITFNDYYKLFRNKNSFVRHHYTFTYTFTPYSVTVRASNGTKVIYSVHEVENLKNKGVYIVKS